MKKAIQTDLFGNPISDSCEADKNKKEAPANTPAIDERPARQIFLPSADEHLKLAANFRYYRLDEIQDHLDGFVDFAKNIASIILMWMIRKNARKPSSSSFQSKACASRT